MKGFRWTAALVISFLVAYGQARAADIKPNETLDLKRCLEIALQRHPGIDGARKSLKVQEAVLGQARSAYFPQVNWQAGAGKRRIESGAPGRQAGTNDDYTASLSLSQNVYDFERTAHRVGIADLNLKSLKQELASLEVQTAYNVKIAYFGALQALRRRDLQLETVRLYTLHLEQAQAFFTAGIKPKFDVTKAEVDLSNARLELHRAGNGFRVSLAVLNNALGLPEAPPFNIEDNLSYERYEVNLEETLRDSQERRPDIQALLIKRTTAGRSIELTKRGHYPQVSASASYSWTGDKFPLDSNWYVGGTVTLPIFSGYLVKNQTEEALANLEVINARIESLKQTVRLEIIQAILNLNEAKERIATAALSIKKATENLDLARGRYAQGVGNPIEVTDGMVALNQAKIAEISALYDHKAARSALEKARGVR